MMLLPISEVKRNMPANDCKHQRKLEGNERNNKRHMDRNDENGRKVHFVGDTGSVLILQCSRR